MTKDKKYMYVGIGVLLVTLILSGVTYAVLTWTSTKTNIGINTDCFTIDYTKGDNITGKLKLLNESDLISEDNKFTIKEGVGLSYANIGIKSTCNIEGYGKIILNITNISDAFINGDSKGALKYAILSNTSTGTVSVDTLKDQSFDVIKKGSITSSSKMDILVKQLSNTTGYKYLIVIYVDNALAGNDVASGTFKGNISAEAYQGDAPIGNAIEYISNLYNDSTKTPVENNSITYQYDTEHSLMKDNDNNIRYYGASPDNYVYFNCDSYGNQSDSTCEKWRIIGIVDGKVKIMRNEIIGELAWDMDKNIDSSKTSYDNNWETSSLQVLLNTSYLNRTEDVTYYSEDSGTTSTIVKTSTMGIKDSTRGLVSESMWYLKGWNTPAVFSDQIYNYERTTGNVYTGRKTSWAGKISLPYPSDYGYAADFNQCRVNLNKYNNATCTGNNWMKSIITNNDGTWGWLLTTLSRNSYSAWNVNSSGYVNYNGSAYYGNGVAPVLYLDSDQEMESGTGKIDNPYRLLTD